MHSHTFGSETSSLTWAQKLHWYLYHSTPPGRRWRNNVLTYWPISADAGIDDCIAALNRLVHEYKGLRTYYPVDARSAPTQVVVPDFRPPLARCDVSGASDEQAAAEAFVERVVRQDFDLAAAPPISAVLVTSGERPRWLALVIHHISIDGAARQVVAKSFEQHLAAVRRGAAAPVPRLASPLSEAIQQNHAAGRGQSAASLRRWSSVAAELPATTLPVAGVPATGPLPTEALLRTGGAAACGRIAKRSAGPVPAVFLGAYSAVLGRCLGLRQMPVNVYSSNRFSPDQAELVGCLYQTLPLLIDLTGDELVGALVQRSQRALLDTYRFGRYDYEEFTDKRVREQFRAGRNVSVMPSFNFPSGGAAVAGGSAAPAAGWSVTPIEHDLGDPFELVVQVAGPEVRWAVRFDAALVAPDLVTDLVSAMHRFLDAADRHPNLSVDQLLDAADVPELKRGPEWMQRSGSWIHLDGIAEAARCHPAVADAVVVAEPDESLTLHAAVTAELTAFGLRCYLTDLLSALPGIVVPDMFVLQPADTWTGEAAARPAPAPGSDGRQPDRRPFDTVRGLAFESALGRVRPGSSWTASEPYLLQGGRTADLSRIIDELAAEGLSGLTPADFLGFRSLAELAEAAVVLRSEYAVRPAGHRPGTTRRTASAEVL
jgi:hypothetical protein